MTALDFPNSPTTGQTFTVEGKTWTYTGTRWEVVAGPLLPTVRTVTSSTALVADDQLNIVRFNGTSTQTLTVNNVLDVGGHVTVIQDNSGSVDLQSGSGVTLLSSTGGFSTRGQNSVVTIRCVATGQYRVTGDLMYPLAITGGTLTSDATYYYRTFTSTGTLAVENGDVVVDILAVAGGGTGGAITIGQTVRGAGGGAGGLVYLSSYTLPASSYVITVGAGGASASGSAVSKGSDSVITGNGRTITTYGGGSGGYNDSTNNATSGGSGAGQWYPGYTGTAATQPSTTNDGVATYAGTGFGNKGGDSGSSQPYASGGGGAGAAGKNFNAVGGPVGGVGRQYSEFATATSTGANGGYYAGGGGGAGYPPEGGYAEYAGGLGGGGTGSNDSFATISNGTAYTGGGGGSGGSGGSGVVIVRYAKSQVD